MKVKSSLKAGGQSLNHNQVLLGTRGLKVRSNVKAGGQTLNHNQVLVRIDA